MRERPVGEQVDIAAPFPQGRQLECEYRQPMVEIFAKPSLEHRGQQWLVGGGDDRHVGRLALCGTEPANTALLDDREELGLEAERKQADLVEEQRATAGDLKESRLRAGGVRERAPLVAEQLGFEERLGNRRTVEVHKWGVCTRSGAVYYPPQQSLAGPGFTADQDRRQPT